MKESSWNSSAWLKQFIGADYLTDHRLLAKVYQNTVQVVQQGHYVTEDGTLVTLPDDREMITHSFLATEELSAASVPVLCDAATITVENVECIDAGIALQQQGFNPAVLNLADAYQPGGLVLQGSHAQEESLFRRTNLFRSLYQFDDEYAQEFKVPQPQAQRYPMDQDWGGIYTPGALVIRAPQDAGFKLLNEPVKMSFIAVAGINDPILNDSGLMDEIDSETTRNKMRTILRLGALNGHDALVLGALGCGAFHNPPKQVAQLFHEVIDEKEFRGKFRHITFAVLARSSSPTGNRNFAAFKQEFEG